MRDARIKAAVELAANPPYTDADMEDGAHLYDMLRNDPDVENGLDSDDGEAPPLYKLSTGGRILGTGDPEVRSEE